jgi:hypothetical protein
VRASFRPELGHPSAAIRIALLLVFIGVYGYLLTVWFAKFGVIVAFVLIPLVINLMVRTIRVLRVAIHVAYGWYVPKSHRVSDKTSLLWDAELDQNPGGAG